MYDDEEGDRAQWPVWRRLEHGQSGWGGGGPVLSRNMDRFVARWIGAGMSFDVSPAAVVERRVATGIIGNEDGQWKRGKRTCRGEFKTRVRARSRSEGDTLIGRAA